MRLLEKPLPRMSLRPRIAASEFFDRCEGLASEVNARIDRRRDYAGPGFDQLNLWFREKPNELMLRMIATPHDSSHVACDVVAWSSGSPTYDEYVKRAKAAFQALVRNYSKTYGPVRLRIERKAPTWDWDEKTVNCIQLQPLQLKFHEAVRALAVGAGDSRTRLRSAYLILHAIWDDELPPPLRSHFEWVVSQLTWRKPRWKDQGTLEATLAAMTRAKGATIAERIVEICEALDALCPSNRL